MKAFSDIPESGGGENGNISVLSGILAVTIEQAVAAPYASSRGAGGGARVSESESPPAGAFARHYDSAVHGESTHFVWLNQGKESAALDFKTAADMRILRAILTRADIFVENLSPGAIERAGIDLAEIREKNPRLITCFISGYGENNEYTN